MSALPRVNWSALDTAARAGVLRRPTQAVAESVRDSVAQIIATVRTRGDSALREFGKLYDRVALAEFAVGRDESAAANTMVSPELRAAIETAARRIENYHRAGMAQPYAFDSGDGVVCERILRGIARVGLYVPAGSAPLPSTALMLGVPARLASCRDVVLCTPPHADGSVDPLVLYAAQVCGITRVFKLGGAQAIAAMAYGTASVPKCDKLFGPGNPFVTEAKRQVSMDGEGAAIDMPAGPSEVLVIADAGANPAFVAADLLSQAEHGPDSQVLLLSDDAALLDAVEADVARQLAALPRVEIAKRSLLASRAILVDSLDDAFSISNEYAPEHLILALRDARRWLDRVEAAGSVFLGDFAAEALGDYCSGTNHVLPTGGAARALSGLSVASFQNAISVQTVDQRGLQAIGPTAVALARAEGLDAHANAVALRLVEAAAFTRCDETHRVQQLRARQDAEGQTLQGRIRGNTA
jgi:histidinol dehydrogenase